MNKKIRFGFEHLRIENHVPVFENYEGEEPAFFDPAPYPWVKQVEGAWEQIKAELMPLMKQEDDRLLPYFSDAMQSRPASWRTYGFYFWGRKNRKNCKRFPFTDKLLRSIPGMVGASFNLLEPHADIMPHCGDTNAIFRCHLGLSVPAGLPECGFTVRGETRPWEEGKLFLFCDSYMHHAFNFSSGNRYILLLDVIRPEFSRDRRYVCSRVLAGLSVHKIITLFPTLTNAIDKLYALLKYPLTALWYVLSCFGY